MAKLEVWGLGVLGLSRNEFRTCSMGELNRRMEGYFIRELQLANIGSRKIVTMIHNGMAGFGGGKQLSEDKLWPMEIDGMQAKKVIPKSEELVKQNTDWIRRFWPDAKING